MASLAEVLTGKPGHYEGRSLGEGVQLGDVVVMGDVREAGLQNGGGTRLVLAEQDGAMARAMQTSLQAADSRE